MKRLRLRKYTAAIIAAEERRASLELELLQAEAELDKAFNALFEDYLQKPYPIQIDRAELEKASELFSVWSSHIRRRYPDCGTPKLWNLLEAQPSQFVAGRNTTFTVTDQ